MPIEWTSSYRGYFVKCPVKGCTHTGDIITKAHFRLNHNISREEAGEIYGGALQIKYKLTNLETKSILHTEAIKRKKHYFLSEERFRNVQFI